MADKTYINKVTLKENKFGGLMFSGSAEEVIEQIREHTNEKGWFNFIIGKRREVGKYGETHYIQVAEQRQP